MDNISANLAIGRREKNIWGYKFKLQDGQEAYKKNRKKSGNLFFIFMFLETKNFVGGGKKISRGHQMVTLRH